LQRSQKRALTPLWLHREIGLTHINKGKYTGNNLVILTKNTKKHGEEIPLLNVIKQLNNITQETTIVNEWSETLN